MTLYGGEKRAESTLAQVMAAAWRHKAIIWTNVDLSSVRFCGIHFLAITWINGNAHLYVRHSFAIIKGFIDAEHAEVRSAKGYKTPYNYVNL